MMKTSFVPFTALSLLLLSGCSVFGGSDYQPAPEAPAEADPTAPVRPSEPPPPLAGTPASTELDESFGVFVVATAETGGDGSRARPFATIADGIAAAKKDGKRVYVCEGSFKESIVIEDGISMLGGLDCSVATWKLGTGRSKIEATSIPAITVTNITKPTRFARFDVTTPDATKPGESSIALFAKGASLFTVDSARITAGNGAKGEDGIDPQQKVDGADVDGKLGRSYGRWCSSPTCIGFPLAVSGGDGGTNTCGGAAGGTGGTGGLWTFTYDGTALRYMWKFYKNDANNTARYGTAGIGKAVNGTDGSSATSSGTFTREGFVPASGTKGSNGSAGKSGAGGNGQAPIATNADADVAYYGIQGSGGGAGGCGGDAGTPGTGGGASITVFVSEGAPEFVDAELVAKNGGAGGKGTMGSYPTPGGKGGMAILGAPSTAGWDGLPGGLAGYSGSGAGGPSVAIVHFGAVPKTERTMLTVGAGGSGVPAMGQGGRTIPASASGGAVKTIAVANEQ